MYNWNKLAADTLNEGLLAFEQRNTYDLDDSVLDRIWDVTLRLQQNTRIKRFYGRYYTHSQVIEVVPHMFDNNPTKFRDTVLHELAHHIASIVYGKREGHGRGWKHICRVVGATPSATSSIKEWRGKHEAAGQPHKEYLL